MTLVEILKGATGFLPFVILFAGLVLTRIKSGLVALISLLITAVLSYLIWDAALETIWVSAAEGFFLSLLPIIWVIFAAVFTYLLGVKTGAVKTIQEFLKAITPERDIQAVLIAFCFGGFLEAVAGFGTAVAIPTAMLMALGYNPVRAAVISLVANSVPVAFGALGIPVIVLSQITALDTMTLSRYVAFQLLPFAVLIPSALVLISRGTLKGSWPLLKDALIIGVLFTVAQTLTALYIGPELVAVLGSLTALGGYFLYSVLIKKVRVDYPAGKILFSLLNYGILLVLVLATRLIKQLSFLSQVPFALKFQLPEAVTVKWDLVTTPGTLLLFSAIAGALIQGLKWKEIFASARETAFKIRWSALTIIGIVALAKLMGHTGMISSVAVLLAGIAGPVFPFLSPILGALGTFVTGSDTSSNILFGQLQKETAIKLGFSPEWLSAANTAGATAGKMISPQSISVAASTVGLESQENEIIRITMVYCLVYACVLGAYILVISWIIL